MKILVLTDFYPPYYKGGHELQCKVIADELSKKNYDIFVLTSIYGVNRKSVDGKNFRLLSYFSVDNTKGFTKRYRQIKTFFLSWRNYFITKKIIKYVDPDIVYAGQLSWISIFPMKAIQKEKVPIVHHLGNYFFVELVRDCILESNPIKKLYRKIIYGFSSLEKFDFKHIITVSEAVRKKYLEIGFSENNISVIPRGVFSDLIKKEFKKSSGFSEKLLKLLYVGRISEKKGVYVAIESVEYLINHLKLKNLILDIIGDGDRNYIKELRVMVDKQRIKEFVKFKGKIEQRDVLKIYKDYDILLFPSIWDDPFSGVLREAMSQGLPIVATNTGGTPEIITHGWNGLLVPPRNPIKMAEAIKQLIEDPSLYEQISINGIKEVREKYTNEKIIEQIDKYLKDTINKKNICNWK